MKCRFVMTACWEEFLMRDVFRSKISLAIIPLVAVIAVFALPWAGFAHGASATTLSFSVKGGLDCNGFSKVQKLIKPDMSCIDFGHDEPVMSFFSNAPGSGNNVQWQITLPKERPLPATQTFENYITFWFGMVLFDPIGFPQTPCIPDSDKNAPPRFLGDSATSGSAFLELQFYPPGFSPFINQISCDLKHWCAALNIDSLECGPGFVCNPTCTEPVNFSFLQRDGIPTGPPGPASQTNATFIPNGQTLLMNQGDKLKVTLKDTPNGLLTRADDLTTRKSGFVVAGAKNGFQSLNLNTCAPTNFNFLLSVLCSIRHRCPLCIHNGERHPWIYRQRLWTRRSIWQTESCLAFPGFQ